MAGVRVRLFTDEHIDPQLARALGRRGYDVESCHEAGRANQGISDELQLAYAAQRGRVILTFNYVDYLRLDTGWRLAGRQHAGIIVSKEIRDLGELLRRVERHLNTYGPEVQRDTLLWLHAGP